MSDLIDRQRAINVLEILADKMSDAGKTVLAQAVAVLKDLQSEEPEPKWIPFTMREVTAEEKEVYPEWDSILDCKLPDDGEEILVSNGKYVWLDTFINDCDGCYLDGGDDVEGLAWQPLPKPWNGTK